VKAEKPLFLLLLLLLAWIPVPLGSNRPWAWSVLEIACFALMAAWLALWAAGRVDAPPALRRAWPAFAILALWLLEQALHLVPMPVAWIAVLSPEAAKMHLATDALGIQPAFTTLSVDAFATRTALLKGLAYACLFALTLALVGSRARLLTLARVLVYWAVALSVVAVLMHLAGVRASFFGTVIDHGAKASGPFVNRNHFAGYLEMTLSLGIGLLIAGLSDRRASSWKRFFANAIDWVLSPKMVLRLALCILVVALTTTHSRMGNAAFFSSMLVAGAIGITLSRHATRNTVILLASLMIIDVAIVGSWFGVERLAQRIQETTALDVEQREEPAAYTLGMIRDYPVFGAGPGSFYAVFPRYRPETVAAFYNHAHNDYAEIAAESGVLGLGISGAFVIVSLGAALRAQWLRRDPLMRGMSFACIMGVTAILIHSWVDFNLQIPANAAYFMVLLALGWISLHLGRE
jgi:putative inorganic carbon (HCO3(-)) transporter